MARLSRCNSAKIFKQLWFSYAIASPAYKSEHSIIKIDIKFWFAGQVPGQRWLRTMLWAHRDELEGDLRRQDRLQAAAHQTTPEREDDTGDRHPSSCPPSAHRRVLLVFRGRRQCLHHTRAVPASLAHGDAQATQGHHWAWDQVIFLTPIYLSNDTMFILLLAIFLKKHYLKNNN